MSDEFAYKRDKTLQARLSAEIEIIAKQPGNAICADCGETKRIRFCSVTLGVFLCNRCYGLHRALGAHVTRGKCLGLDAWKEEEINLLRAVGNARAKAMYEATVPTSVVRPTASSSDRQVAAWIKDKYERKKYYAASHVQSAPHAAPTPPAPVPVPVPMPTPPPAPSPPPAAATVDLLGELLSPAAPAASTGSSSLESLFAAAPTAAIDVSEFGAGSSSSGGGFNAAWPPQQSQQPQPWQSQQSQPWQPQQFQWPPQQSQWPPQHLQQPQPWQHHQHAAPSLMHPPPVGASQASSMSQSAGGAKSKEDIMALFR